MFITGYRNKVTEIPTTPDSENEVDEDLCKFNILFIVNNPEGCQNDADILTYYRTYFGESNGPSLQRETNFTISELFLAYTAYKLLIVF